MPPLIHVAPVSAAIAAGVRAVEVTVAQAQFVGNTAFNLMDAEQDPASEPMAILADAEVVGFYRLDFASNTVLGRALGAPTVGLRAFAIDRRRQGLGYGVRAIDAMARDLGKRHPDRRLVLLAVNCCNHGAVSAYRAAGFVATGELMRGGRAGPQHVMLRYLPAAGEHARHG